MRSSLESEVASLRAEVGKLRGKSVSCDHEEELSALRKELEQAREVGISAREAAEEAKAEVAAAAGLVGKLRTALSQAEKEARETRASATQLARELAGARAVADEAARESEAYSSEVGRLGKEVKRLDAALSVALRPRVELITEAGTVSRVADGAGAAEVLAAIHAKLLESRGHVQVTPRLARRLMSDEGDPSKAAGEAAQEVLQMVTAALGELSRLRREHDSILSGLRPAFAQLTNLADEFRPEAGAGAGGHDDGGVMEEMVRSDSLEGSLNQRARSPAAVSEASRDPWTDEFLHMHHVTMRRLRSVFMGIKASRDSLAEDKRNLTRELAMTKNRLSNSQSNLLADVSTVEERQSEIDFLRNKCSQLALRVEFLSSVGKAPEGAAGKADDDKKRRPPLKEALQRSARLEAEVASLQAAASRAEGLRAAETRDLKGKIGLLAATVKRLKARIDELEAEVAEKEDQLHDSIVSEERAVRQLREVICVEGEDGGDEDDEGGAEEVGEVVFVVSGSRSPSPPAAHYFSPTMAAVPLSAQRQLNPVVMMHTQPPHMMQPPTFGPPMQRRR